MITESPLFFAFLIASKEAIPLSTVITSPLSISSTIFSDNPYPSENLLGSLVFTAAFNPSSAMYVQSPLLMISVAQIPSTS